MEPLLKVENLTVEYGKRSHYYPAVRQISFQVNKGEVVGMVGESGSGKSTVALALMGLLPSHESRVPEGQVFYKRENILDYGLDQWQQLRGRKIAMIFQDPFSSLNPVLTIDYQLKETGNPDLNHLLKLVQLEDHARILQSYPHQLSGGQRQRIMIAMALARQPDLLIADEPTTALDVTVQDEIVKLLKSLQTELGMALLFITHNLGLIKNISNRLAVMYAGQIIEQGDTSQILSTPSQPYTQGLLESIPKLKKSQGPIPVLEGTPPHLTSIPTGCPFHPRCKKIFEPCRTIAPRAQLNNGVDVRCHLYTEK